MQMKALLWNVEGHDVTNRRMTDDWFLAAVADDAVTAAKFCRALRSMSQNEPCLSG
jgi:hypothetical protein